MKAQLLSILMMGSVCAFGKGDEIFTNDAQKLTLPGSYGGGGGSNVHGSLNCILGYAGTTSNAGFSGGSFLYGVGVGLEIVLPSQSDNKAGILSLGVGMTGYSFKGKYTDKAGNSQSSTHVLSGVLIPIMYTSMVYGRNGEDGSGFYWQLGGNAIYTAKVTSNSKPETDLYSRILFEPTVGLGLHTPFTLKMRGSGNEVGGGRVFFGPFFSYVVNNMWQGSGVDMHSFKIGVRYNYIFM